MKELAELDQQIASVDEEEKLQQMQIANFEAYREQIEQEENNFWREFNQFE